MQTQMQSFTNAHISYAIEDNGAGTITRTSHADIMARARAAKQAKHAAQRARAAKARAARALKHAGISNWRTCITSEQGYPRVIVQPTPAVQNWHPGDHYRNNYRN
jgi:hypothetical protein